MGYTTERYTAEMSAEAYIEGFRDAERFVGYCRQCGNYGRRHGCPPFADDPLKMISGFSRVRIIGVKIVPDDLLLPLLAANELMEPVVRTLNDELLDLEQELAGRAFGFVGACPYCGGAPCARIEGLPCRHPEKVRPSLEAIGFDVGKTASRLLGLDIKWSHDGRLPEYLTLVCGLFYSTKS